ncbi:DUF6931 family protein [Aquisphaera insulae]|uniref:DUF6931 family protein n=1 Tax=Aquisphaera insulae TaxID=2712864 RepID=UPI0013EAD13C|nr:hypothetical protein [Aquisphaera insulae]
MSDLVFIDERYAVDVARRAGLGEAATALLRDGMSPGGYLEALAASGPPLDGIRFLAHAMARRAVVWWACRCVTTLDPDGSAAPAAEAALKAAREWVTDPSDDRRRACWPAAEGAGIGTPAGCTALAAFLSGGSLAPAELQAVPPGEDLTPRAAIGAIMLASVVREPEKVESKYAASFAIGRDVAEGKDTWPAPSRILPPKPVLKKR